MFKYIILGVSKNKIKIKNTSKNLIEIISYKDLYNILNLGIKVGGTLEIEYCKYKVVKRTLDLATMKLLNVKYKIRGTEIVGVVDDEIAVIPEGITSVKKFGKNVKEVILPDSVKSIGIYSFEGCTNLINISIPDSVKSISKYAFQGCTNLTNIIIPDSIKSIGYCAFQGCTSLTNIIISDSVKSIGDYVFEGCTNLTNIIIPDSVKSISRYAFEGCTSLVNISLPASVSLGKDCFKDCTKLKIHWRY